MEILSSVNTQTVREHYYVIQLQSSGIIHIMYI